MIAGSLRNRVNLTGHRRSLLAHAFALWLISTNVAHAGDKPLNPSPARPAGSPGTWASDDDYPTDALREHAEGKVGFTLAVGADGVPTQCEVSQSSGNADLDGTTCRLMMARARFIPATDATGHATKGVYSSQVRWKVPGDGQRVVPPSGAETVEYDVLPDGSMANCKVTISGEIAKYVSSNERTARCAREGPFAPPTDGAGKPVKKHVVSTDSIAVTIVR